MKRRAFLAGVVSTAAAACARPADCAGKKDDGSRLVMFSTGGKIGLIGADGGGGRVLTFDVPDQSSWSPGPFFSDRRRMLVTSYASGAAWKGNVRTRLWILDLSGEGLTEIVMKDRPADQIAISALLPGDQRMVAGPIIDGEQRVTVMNLDGTDPVEITKKGEGFAYCASPSPDGKRIAYHITGEKPYRIVVADIDGAGKTVVAEHPEHLYFGPAWSPDGAWLLYQDCHVLNARHETIDPGHDWSDLCIGRPNGRKGPEHRVVTSRQSAWFAASFGDPKRPETVRSGSNLPVWSPAGGTVTWIRRTPGSRTPWTWATDRPDKDHFNRDFRPEQSRGGTHIRLFDPFSGAARDITQSEPHRWDCYPAWSPDGKKIAFSRMHDGGVPELWIVDADGGNARFLTHGQDAAGAIYPRFVG